MPDLSAAANVFLGRTMNWGPFISGRATRQRFKELADPLGADIDPYSIAGSLSVANQQLLEIMRALEAEHRILILDEPTTSLGAPERQKLYAIVNDLRRRGLAIIFISHDLDEILSLCDRVTVMRDGEMVATKPVGGVDQTNAGRGNAGRRGTTPDRGAQAARSRASIGREGVGDSGPCGRNLVHLAQRGNPWHRGIDWLWPDRNPEGVGRNRSGCRGPNGGRGSRTSLAAQRASSPWLRYRACA